MEASQPKIEKFRPPEFFASLVHLAQNFFLTNLNCPWRARGSRANSHAANHMGRFCRFSPVACFLGNAAALVGRCVCAAYFHGIHQVVRVVRVVRVEMPY